MTLFSKALTLTAGAAALVATAPLQARDRYDRDGIDAGDVIAGALIIGGIAAIASAGSGRDRYGRDYGYGHSRDYGYGRSRGYDYDDDYDRSRYGSRQAVDQCVHAAKREAGRYGWARVTDVTSINRVSGGYEVRGRLVVETRGRGYDRGYHYDRYGNDYDKGRFTCVSRYGGVDDLRVSGLRGYY